MITSPQNFNQFGSDCFSNRYDYFLHNTSTMEKNLDLRDEKTQNNIYKIAIENMAKDIVPQPVKEEKNKKIKVTKKRAVSPVLVRMRKELNTEESLNYIQNGYKGAQDINNIGYNPNLKKERYSHISLRQATSRNLGNEPSKNYNQIFENLKFQQSIPESKSVMLRSMEFQNNFRSSNLNFPSSTQNDNATLFPNAFPNSYNSLGQGTAKAQDEKEYYKNLQQIVIMTPSSNLTMNMNPTFDTFNNINYNQNANFSTFGPTNILNNSNQNNQFNFQNVVPNIAPQANSSNPQNSINFITFQNQPQQMNTGTQYLLNQTSQAQQLNLLGQSIKNISNQVNSFSQFNQNNNASQISHMNYENQMTQLNQQNNLINQINQSNLANSLRQSRETLQSPNNSVIYQPSQYLYCLPTSQNFTKCTSQINNPSSISNGNSLYYNMLNISKDGYSTQPKDSNTNLQNTANILQRSQSNLSPMNLKVLKSRYPIEKNKNNSQAYDQSNISSFHTAQGRKSICNYSTPSLYKITENGKRANENSRSLQIQSFSNLKNDKPLTTPIRI